MSKQQKSKTHSSTSNRAPKDARKAVKSALTSQYPEMVAAMGANQLMANTVDPARSVPSGYPDAYNPFSHAVHHRLVQNFTAVAPATEFSFVARPDPDNLLNVYVQGQIGDSVISTVGSGFILGSNPLSGASYWISTASGRDFNYGRLPLDTGSYPLVSGHNDSGDPLLVFKTNNGQSFQTLNNYGSLDVNPTGVSTVYTATMTMAVTNYAVAANTTWTFQESASATGPFATIGTVTGVETPTALVITTSASTARYIRLLYATSVATTQVAPRSMNSLTVSIASSATIFPPSLTPYQIQSMSTLRDSTKGFRFVGLTILVTNMSSDLANGGNIAGAQLGSNYTVGDGFPNYDTISRLPNAFNGPFKKGCFGFWSPESATDMAFVAWDSNVSEALPFLAVGGTFASVGGAVRVQVDAIVEYITENEAFGPCPSRTAVWEIEARAEVLSRVVCHFVENPLHEKLQAIMKKASDIFQAAKPYAEKAWQVGKMLAPIAPLLLAL